MAEKPISVYMVAAGQFHDIDFARLELLKLLAEDERIRTTVAANYSDTSAIAASDFLITLAHAWGDIPDNWGDIRTKGASTNRLVDDDRTYDRITGMPRMSAIPVNLKQVVEESV